jgi:peptidoglycan/xylan/chitin deacetylase (PgdA/CDA1 family)
MNAQQSSKRGAFVVSLDFELRWGLREIYPIDGGAYRANLLGARTAIPRMLDLFEEFGICATWATVGLMMAESREEMERFKPRVEPAYEDPGLNPYRDDIGANEDEDPLHYAGSLIDQIRARQGQEIASHTFGHYYPLEPGHDAASFTCDLESAVAIATAKGIELRSLVFPRNQFKTDNAEIIARAGFTCCRTNAAGRIYREASSDRYFRTDIRARRLLDCYLPISGSQVIRWDDVRCDGSLCFLPASHFLRPYSPKLRHLDPLRLRRITSGIKEAAKTGGLYHLWWHPHNAGVHTDEFITFLRQILEVFAECRAGNGMESLSMDQVANRVHPTAGAG